MANSLRYALVPSFLLVAQCAAMQLTAATVRVGLNFVSEAETIDFIDPFVIGDPPISLVHYIEPWNLTTNGSHFVVDGAFAESPEEDVRAEVYTRVVSKYFELPTPAGFELNVDLIYGEVTGPSSVNVIIGQHTISGTPNLGSWFGLTDAMVDLQALNGENLAAISVDRISQHLGIPFDTRAKAINSIANVTAHEIAHLFRAEHVCASASNSECGPDDTVVSNPYDLMSTGPSGLPSVGWTQDNIFTSVPGTQLGGLSTFDFLVDRIGLRRIGDTDTDGDVDTFDVTQALANFTSNVGFQGSKTRQQGDLDHDRDVDTADITKILMKFTGAHTSLHAEDQSMALLESATIDAVLAAIASESTPSLIYDHRTGSVNIFAGSEDLVAFNVTNTSGPFDPADFDAPSSEWIDLPGLFENTSHSIGWISSSATEGSGLSNGTSLALGRILPPQLSALKVSQLLDGSSWARLGHGGDFQLVVIPEPTTLAMCSIGLIGLVLRRRNG